MGNTPKELFQTLLISAEELSFPDRNGWELKVHQMMKGNKSEPEVIHVMILQTQSVHCQVSQKVSYRFVAKFSIFLPLF